MSTAVPYVDVSPSLSVWTCTGSPEYVSSVTELSVPEYMILPYPVAVLASRTL